MNEKEQLEEAKKQFLECIYKIDTKDLIKAVVEYREYREKYGYFDRLIYHPDK